jgi:hypothetical protein
LLFSDGIGNFGKQELSMPNSPVICINSAISADYSYLKNIAQQSHGKFIDLNTMEHSRCIEEIKQESLQLVSTEYDPGEISDLALQTPLTIAGGFLLRQIKNSKGKYQIEYGFRNRNH